MWTRGLLKNRCHRVRYEKPVDAAVSRSIVLKIDTNTIIPTSDIFVSNIEYLPI